MSNSLSRLFPAVLALLCLTSVTSAVTIQDASDVLADGSAYLFVEAESALLEGDPDLGWLVVTKDNPIQTIDTAIKGGLDVLPATTNASGGSAIFDQLTGGHHADKATLEVQFATPATYYLYMHVSIYNSDANTTYGNEDSIYLAPAWNATTNDSWIGFPGVDQEGNELIGDHANDGWMPLFNNKVVVSAGEQEVHNNTDEDFWDGQFHWMFAGVAVDVSADGVYIDDFGQVLQYPVTQADVGKTLGLTFSTREHYGVIDSVVFSTSNQLLEDYRQDQMDEFFLGPPAGVPGDFDNSGDLGLPDVNMLNAAIAAGTNDVQFDLNTDQAVNTTDLNVWVKDLRKTWFGDANLDSQFNSGDLVVVFQAGKFELDTAATWDQGDWNGDLRFNSGDLVSAFQDGGFEQGPPPAGVAVPEPSACILLACGVLGLVVRRRR
jgi:hypothetical protein